MLNIILTKLAQNYRRPEFRSVLVLRPVSYRNYCCNPRFFLQSTFAVPANSRPRILHGRGQIESPRVCSGSMSATAIFRQLTLNPVGRKAIWSGTRKVRLARTHVACLPWQRERYGSTMGVFGREVESGWGLQESGVRFLERSSSRVERY